MCRQDKLNITHDFGVFYFTCKIMLKGSIFIV